MFTFPFTMYGIVGLLPFSVVSLENSYNTSTGHGDATAGITFNTDGTTTKEDAFTPGAGPIWLVDDVSSNYWLYSAQVAPPDVGSSIFPAAGWNHMSGAIQVSYERINTTQGDFSYSTDVFIQKSVSAPVTTPTFGNAEGSTYMGRVNMSVHILNNA